MVNKTERLQLEFGRNKRWQNKAAGGFPSVFPVEERLKVRGKVLKGYRDISREDREIMDSVREMLNPVKR